MAQEKESKSIVISTRIRLARNFASYPFPHKMDEGQAEDVLHLVKEGLKQLDEFVCYPIGEMSEEKALLLQERHLISPALCKSKYGAAFVAADELTSVMVNEEDHLREQYIHKGVELYKGDELQKGANLYAAYERICALDDGLGSLYDFAFDKKLGYLTACPSNLGTGMRASVMMFLPGIGKNGELKKVIPSLKANGMTVRGAFGEGTTAEGHVYQVSNERTLGRSEEDILELVKDTVNVLCDLENRAREDILHTAKLETLDRCLRSYGVLTNCAKLDLKEFFARIEDVKLGVALGFFDSVNFDELHDFIDGMRPTVFRIKNDLQDATEEETEAVRAETACTVLPRLVRVAKK